MWKLVLLLSCTSCAAFVLRAEHKKAVSALLAKESIENIPLVSEQADLLKMEDECTEINCRKRVAEIFDARIRLAYRFADRNRIELVLKANPTMLDDLSIKYCESRPELKNDVLKCMFTPYEQLVRESHQAGLGDHISKMETVTNAEIQRASASEAAAWNNLSNTLQQQQMQRDIDQIKRNTNSY